jgi:hypothetical protein
MVTVARQLKKIARATQNKQSHLALVYHLMNPF